jgi:hypothetical protein
MKTIKSFLLELLGKVPKDKLDKMHISRREPQIAINESVERSLDNLMEIVQGLEKDDKGNILICFCL